MKPLFILNIFEGTNYHILGACKIILSFKTKTHYIKKHLCVPHMEYNIYKKILIFNYLTWKMKIFGFKISSGQFSALKKDITCFILTYLSVIHTVSSSPCVSIATIRQPVFSNWSLSFLTTNINIHIS